MNSKLQAKILTMAAATLGLSLVGGCAKKSEPAAEGGEATSGAESSCGGGSCGAAHEGEKKEGESTAPTEAAPEGGEATP